MMGRIGVLKMAETDYTYCTLCSKEAKHPAYIKNMTPGRGGYIYRGRVCDQCVTKPYVFPDAKPESTESDVPTITQLRDCSAAIVSEIEFLIYQLNRANLPRQDKGELMSLIKAPTAKLRRQFKEFDYEWKNSQSAYPNHLSGRDYLTLAVELFNAISKMWWGLQDTFHTIRDVIN